MRRLSPQQIAHIRALRDNPGRTSYPGLNLGTLQSLQRRKLATAKHGLGSMAFPANSIQWWLTDDGRAAGFQLHHTKDPD